MPWQDPQSKEQFSYKATKNVIQKESMENHNNGEDMATILEVESIQGH